MTQYESLMQECRYFHPFMKNSVRYLVDMTYVLYKDGHVTVRKYDEAGHEIYWKQSRKMYYNKRGIYFKDGKERIYFKKNDIKECEGVYKLENKMIAVFKDGVLWEKVRRTVYVMDFGMCGTEKYCRYLNKRYQLSLPNHYPVAKSADYVIDMKGV